MEDPGILILLFFLIIFSGIFSGSESALLSLEETKLRAMKEKKMIGIGFLEKIKAQPKKLIITILIANNIINILIPILATLWGTKNFGESSLAVITFVLTILLITFGEVLPKNLALAHNQRFSLIIAPVIYFLSKLFGPVVWCFEKLTDLVSPPGNDQTRVTEAEVLAMVSMGAEHGEITTEQKGRIESLLDFSNTTVQEIMTPRTKINALEDDTLLAGARKVFLENSHTRVPVYKEDIDHITDIITLRDILEYSEEHSDEKQIKNLELKTPYFVPITKKISSLFADFQRQHTHIAIVLDEHGGTAGLITMEDIFEEIFGEIQDETDEEESEMETLNDGVWKISPRMTCEEIFEETGIWISNDDDDTEKSLSLLILEKLERFPRKGETIPFDHVDLVVEKMGEKSLEQLRMVKKN